MGDQSIRVLVECRIESEDLQDALDVYRELISKTRQEAGCIRYEILQLREDSHEFLLAEEWESQEHLDAHTRTEHFVLAMAMLETLETARPALIYQPLL
ncbi:putative quinol monooxygenase [Aeromicrobium sp. P5_D10]